MAQIGPMNPGKLANTASIEASKPRNGSPARVANSASTNAAVTNMVMSVGRRSRGAPAGTAKKRPVNACSAVPSCTCMTPVCSRPAMPIPPILSDSHAAR